ncbi:lysis protein [Cronobacter turicensis]
MATVWGFVRAWWKPLLFLAAVGFALYYRASLTKAEASLTEVNRELKLAKDDIADMQQRQRDVAALDAKYTQELEDAKANINQLERDVATGKRRLQLNAMCRKNGAASATSLDDATSPRLTDAAERDYFTLRERIESSRNMIEGMQDYIKSQCLKLD